MVLCNIYSHNYEAFSINCPVIIELALEGVLKLIINFQDDWLID
jgi:hypothetical protein